MSTSELWRGVSINQNASKQVDELVRRADDLRVVCTRNEDKVSIIDAGIEAPGGIEAGRLIAEICLGGLGRVSFSHSGLEEWPLGLSVTTSNPTLACLCSQYAGWSLSHKDGDQSFYALGSGPARALARKEELFGEIQYKDTSDTGVLILEVDKSPPRELLFKIATDCGLQPENLTVILTPTQSLAGGVQVVARVLEVAMHKVHELKFPLEHIIDGYGSAPLSPPASDMIVAMGRTNDAILFAGQVHLFVEGERSDAHDLCAALPSSASRDYGKPFAAIFKEYDYDFFKIDPMLFSPAKVFVTHVSSGHTFQAGGIDLKLLKRSFDY